MARWILFLSSYNFRIEYKPGVEIPHADALSRLEPGTVAVTSLEPSFSSEDLLKAQEDDDTLKRVMYLLRMGKDIPVGERREVVDIMKQRKNLFFTD